MISHLLSNKKKKKKWVKFWPFVCDQGDEVGLRLCQIIVYGSHALSIWLLYMMILLCSRPTWSKYYFTRVGFCLAEKVCHQHWLLNKIYFQVSLGSVHSLVFASRRWSIAQFPTFSRAEVVVEPAFWLEFWQGFGWTISHNKWKSVNHSTILPFQGVIHIKYIVYGFVLYPRLYVLSMITPNPQ